jgi:hypothetical protein
MPHIAASRKLRTSHRARRAKDNRPRRTAVGPVANQAAPGRGVRCTRPESLRPVPGLTRVVRGSQCWRTGLRRLKGGGSQDWLPHRRRGLGQNVQTPAPVLAHWAILLRPSDLGAKKSSRPANKFVDSSTLRQAANSVVGAEAESRMHALPNPHAPVPGLTRLVRGSQCGRTGLRRLKGGGSQDWLPHRRRGLGQNVQTPVPVLAHWAILLRPSDLTAEES